MKTQLMGFSWELGRGISIDEFFEHLATLKGQPEKFGDYDRLLYVGSRDGYYVGLFLKIKDQKRSTEITGSGDQFKVTVRSLAEGTNLVDFNFFIINKVTCRGLYQYYHQSCSLNQFGLFCSQQYDGLKESRIETDLKQHGGDEAPAKMQRKVKSQYKGSLRWENIVRSEKLEELLAALDTIKFFDFTLTTIDDSDALLTPLKPFAKKQRRIVRFRPSSDGVVNAIVSIVKSRGITQGRVGGVDAQNRECVYRLLENPDKFGEFEYDDIADETVFNLEEVEKSPFFDKMLAAINGDEGIRAIFESPAQ